MSNERAILCGDVPVDSLPFGGADPVRLILNGHGANVTLRFEDISRPMLKSIPDAFLDLIEIATYVYCADQATTRGGDGVENVGEDWYRQFFFRVPVRNPEFWSSPEASGALCDLLSFLSDDHYVFEFVKLHNPQKLQQYLSIDEGNPSYVQPEEVVLFSGGLDSLGGAIEESVIRKRRVLLVTHRPTSKLSTHHADLIRLLAHHAQAFAPRHVPVTINKLRHLSREYTQRSRSFLYASLATAIAEMVGLSRIRFYENGIVSLNLPLATQVVGARATRTTHPRVIKGFAKLFSLVAGRPFAVENPFMWKTKTEIVKDILAAGCGDTIEPSTSCTHTWEITNLYTHCGRCSQCIDRRFAVLGASAGQHDPGEHYRHHLLVGARDDAQDQTMIASYVETANQITKMGPIEFFARYGEASRVLLHLDGAPDSNAMRLFDLHQRHARVVADVVDRAIGTNARAIRERTLPSTCLLRLVCDSSTDTSTWNGPPPDPQDQPVSASNNTFKRKGQKAWLVRFGGGREFILTPTNGAAYLHELLSNPHREYKVVDLVRAIEGQTEEYQAGDAGPVADRQALDDYHRRLEDLRYEREEALADQDLGRVQRINDETAALEKEIRSAEGLGGALRRVSDEDDNMRKRFLAAIRRVLKEIAASDKALAQHLSRPTLICGWNPQYNPSENIVWDT